MNLSNEIGTASALQKQLATMSEQMSEQLRALEARMASRIAAATPDQVEKARRETPQWP